LKSGCYGKILNQIFVVNLLLRILCDYSEYWDKVTTHDFVASWNILQDIQDGLRVLKRHCGEYQKIRLGIIENQAVTIEKLYPYKVFASAEFVLSDVTCSICGKNIESLECPHIKGELYDGEIAYGIVGKIETVNAMALVDHPQDKRCVVSIMNTEENFSAVAYLAELMNRQRISPWHIFGVKQTTRKKPIVELGKLDDHDNCPCGSGKYYKDCCLKVGYVEVPHMEILVGEARTLVF
jgi:hypothetical protein